MNRQNYFTEAPDSGPVGVIMGVAAVVPYLEIVGEYDVSDRAKISGGLGYSPFVMVEDQDSHLARSPQKFSDGSYDGSSVMFSLGLDYDLQNGWVVEGRLEMVGIEADGEQDARVGANSWTIESEIESSQTMLTVVMRRTL